MSADLTLKVYYIILSFIKRSIISYHNSMLIEITLLLVHTKHWRKRATQHNNVLLLNSHLRQKCVSLSFSAFLSTPLSLSMSRSPFLNFCLFLSFFFTSISILSLSLPLSYLRQNASVETQKLLWLQHKYATSVVFKWHHLRIFTQSYLRGF